MTTIEIIDGKEVTIKWSFFEVMEVHDSNFCDWAMEGEGNDGKIYTGNCGADRNHPHDFHGDVENVEVYEEWI